MGLNIGIITVGCVTVGFSVSLSHLARAEDLGIIPEDRELIQSLVLKIAQFFVLSSIESYDCRVP